KGLALKVLGQNGPSALSATSNTTEQDFLLINHPAFAVPTSHEFVGLVLNAAQGIGTLLRYLIGEYGFFGALSRMKKAAQTFGKPFHGFAAETLFSAVPLSCGPYAVKLRLVPAAGSDSRPIKNGVGYGADMIERLAVADLSYDFQLQFFVDDA